MTELRHAPVRTASAGGHRPAPGSDPSARLPAAAPPPSPSASPRPPGRRGCASRRRLRVSAWLWIAAFGAGLFALPSPRRTSTAGTGRRGERRGPTSRTLGPPAACPRRPDDPARGWRGSAVLIALAGPVPGAGAVRPGPVARWLLTVGGRLTLAASSWTRAWWPAARTPPGPASSCQGGLVVLALLALVQPVVPDLVPRARRLSSSPSSRPRISSQVRATTSQASTAARPASGSAARSRQRVTAARAAARSSSTGASAGSPSRSAAAAPSAPSSRSASRASRPGAVPGAPQPASAGPARPGRGRHLHPLQVPPAAARRPAPAAPRSTAPPGAAPSPPSARRCAW